MNGLPMVKLEQTNLVDDVQDTQTVEVTVKPGASANIYLVCPTLFSVVIRTVATNIAGTVAASDLLQSLQPLQFLQRFFIALPCNRGSGRR